MINQKIILPKTAKILYIDTPSIPPTLIIKYRESTLEIRFNTLFGLSYKINAKNKRVKNMFLDIIKQL